MAHPAHPGTVGQLMPGGRTMSDVPQPDEPEPEDEARDILDEIDEQLDTEDNEQGDAN